MGRAVATILMSVGACLMVARWLLDARPGISPWTVAFLALVYGVLPALYGYLWGHAVLASRIQAAARIRDGACPGCARFRPRDYVVFGRVIDTEESLNTEYWTVCRSCFDRHQSETSHATSN